jgi:hypothetical protein
MAEAIQGIKNSAVGSADKLVGVSVLTSHSSLALTALGIFIDIPFNYDGILKASLCLRRDWNINT